jgi:hypothetical protein
MRKRPAIFVSLSELRSSTPLVCFPVGASLLHASCLLPCRSWRSSAPLVFFSPTVIPRLDRGTHFPHLTQTCGRAIVARAIRAYVVFAEDFGVTRDGEAGQGQRDTGGRFKDRKQLEAWLDGQPREVAIAMAWRSAARVFPLLAGEKPDAAILPVLRAIAVSRFAAVWPNHETEKVQSAADSAASAAGSAAFSADSTADSAASAAYSAAFSADSAANSAAYSAANSAAYSAASAANSAAVSAAYSAAIWGQVTKDARLAEAKGVDALNQAPLWFSLGPEVSESHPPDWVVEEWVALKNQLRSQPRKDFWNVWLGWCDDILHGMSELNRDIEFARLFGHPDAGVEITKDDWKAGPSVVNPKIRQVLDKLPPNRSRRERLGIDEVETPPQPEIKTSSEEVVVRPTTESDFRPDTPDCDVDALGRSLAAFQLAGRLNQVWDAFNSAPDQTTTSEQRREHDSSTWTGLKPVNWDERLKTGFVVHVDAPWGGGKTSFANGDDGLRCTTPTKSPSPPEGRGCTSSRAR